ncbi:MAG: RluA family pseudouridine synthase [Lachnospiraceae bacterium]
MKFTILYEDTHLIVCIKPAGIATQSARLTAADMVSLLKNHLHQQDSTKGEPYLAVIHRLDQPVEGILVFAKTPFAAKELSRQLQQDGFGKHYLALLQQAPKQSEGTLTDYMVKDGKTNTSRICTKDTMGAKKAILEYHILPRDDSFSGIRDFSPDFPLAKIRLETGRHHQIRVQMSHLGCPLVGDQKYNPDYDPLDSRILPGRLALFAYRLEFTHPKTGQKMEFHL